MDQEEFTKMMTGMLLAFGNSPVATIKYDPWIRLDPAPVPQCSLVLSFTEQFKDNMDKFFCDPRHQYEFSVVCRTYRTVHGYEYTWSVAAYYTVSRMIATIIEVATSMGMVPGTSIDLQWNIRPKPSATIVDEKTIELIFEAKSSDLPADWQLVPSTADRGTVISMRDN